MKQKEYAQIRSKLEADLAEAKQRADAIQRRLTALDLVWNEVLQSPVSPSDSDSADVSLLPQMPIVSRESPNTDGEGTMSRIRALLAELPTRFTSNDVAIKLPENTNRTTISGALNKLANKGEIKLLIKGAGRTPSEYERIGATE